MKTLQEEFDELEKYEAKALENNFKQIECVLQEAQNHFNILKMFLKEAGKGTKVYTKLSGQTEYERNKELEQYCED